MNWLNESENLFDQSGRAAGKPGFREVTQEELNAYIASGKNPEAYFAEWERKTQEGWWDETCKIRLKTTEEACNTFANMMTQIEVGIKLGAFDDQTSMPIWDYDGNPRMFSVSDITGLLFRYGVAWAEMFGTYKP